MLTVAVVAPVLHWCDVPPTAVSAAGWPPQTAGTPTIATDTGVLSDTVTVAVQADVFPEPSTTVNTAVCRPSDGHENDEGDTVSKTPPQLSELPPSTCAADSDACPAASTYTVAAWHKATGAETSRTNTSDWQLKTFPEGPRVR